MLTLGNLGPRRAGWIAVLTVAAVAGSLVFACATPFPALATLAALSMNRRDAFILTGVIWIANQTVGYGLLHYPQTWDSFAWGIAIGAGAGIAVGVAIVAENALRRQGWAPTLLMAFAAAFAGYELTLYVATAVLPAEPSAFGAAVVLYIFKVNAIALVCLLVLQNAGTRVGLALPRQSTPSAATSI